MSFDNTWQPQDALARDMLTRKIANDVFTAVKIGDLEWLKKSLQTKNISLMVENPQVGPVASIWAAYFVYLLIRAVSRTLHTQMTTQNVKVTLFLTHAPTCDNVKRCNERVPKTWTKSLTFSLYCSPSWLLHPFMSPFTARRKYFLLNFSVIAIARESFLAQNNNRSWRSNSESWIC